MGLAATSAFYRQLASLLRAGFTMSQALDHAAAGATGWQAQQAPQWSAGCGAGRSLHEQLAASGETPLAVALVRAGEGSGRLPELCERIASIAEHLQRLRGMLVARLIYPFLLANMALAAPGIPKAFLNGTWSSILIGPAILWGLILAVLITILIFRRSGLGSRLALQPGFRFLTLPWVTANTCQVLEAGVAAGMLFHDALDLAAPACGNAVMGERLRTVAADLRHGRGTTLTHALRQAGFSPIVVQLIDTAEISGTLDVGLERAAAYQRDIFESRSLWTGRVIAGICFGAAILTAAYTIISMYAGYLNEALKMMDE